MTLKILGVGLEICGTAIGTCFLATFIQTSLHFVLGHHRFGAWFFPSHVKCHHAIYSGRKLATPEYEDEETSLTLFYLFPCAAACTIAYLVMPRALFWVRDFSQVEHCQRASCNLACQCRRTVKNQIRFTEIHNHHLKRKA